MVEKQQYLSLIDFDHLYSGFSGVISWGVTRYIKKPCFTASTATELVLDANVATSECSTNSEVNVSLIS